MTLEEAMALVESEREAAKNSAAIHNPALRHRIYNATTEALRAELATPPVKDTAILIAWELQRRGEGYKWPFSRARQHSWNRA
jgi:hypothetical protein